MAAAVKNNTTFCFTAALIAALLIHSHADASVRHRRSDDEGPLGAVVASLSQQVTTMSAQLTAMSAEIAQLKTKAAQDETIVAFHARSDDKIDVLPQGPMILSRVVTNIGNGYDEATGYFQAPVSGAYLLIATATCDGSVSGEAWINVMVDNVAVGLVKTDFSPGADDQATVAVPVHMTKGQRAHLKNSGNSQLRLWGSEYTTFSGFLIQSE